VIFIDLRKRDACEEDCPCAACVEIWGQGLFFSAQPDGREAAGCVNKIKEELEI